ncbi:MAG TPA: MFS transporter [Polyangiaceae bacterium]|nr:MFS transporter [Polyangiaceae bacterium]
MHETKGEGSIGELIDGRGMSALQWRVAALCFAVTLLDGFDVQAMAFVAPAVAASWGVGVKALAPVLSASLVGLFVGSLVGGPAGDRYGRKRAMLASFALVGAATLGGATATSMGQLFAWRLLAGVGLGGSIPNALTLTAEYVPARLRAMVLTLMLSGIPVGAALGGGVAARLVPSAGWPAVFVVGGATPLALAAALAWALPESLQFLALQGAEAPALRRLLERLAPGAPPLEALPAPPPSARAAELSRGGPSARELLLSSARSLLRGGRARSTLALWLVFFCNLFTVYLLLSWIPVAMTRAGQPQAAAIRTAVAFNLGGVPGGLLLAALIDRYRFDPQRVLAVAFGAVAALAVAASSVDPTSGAFFAVTTLLGAGVMGGQLGLSALAADVYPTSIRSTGIGWAIGVGRFGAIVSPLVGGYVLARSEHAASLFSLAALPAGVACAGVLFLARARAARAGAPAEADGAAEARGEAPPASTKPAFEA